MGVTCPRLASNESQVFFTADTFAKARKGPQWAKKASPYAPERHRTLEPLIHGDKDTRFHDISVLT